MISDLLSIAKSHATNPHLLHILNDHGHFWGGQRIAPLLRRTTVRPGISVSGLFADINNINFHIGAHADHLVHMHRKTLSKIRIEAGMRMAGDVATLPSMYQLSKD